MNFHEQDTQPAKPLSSISTPTKRRSCRVNLLYLIFGLVVTPVFLCGLTLVTYLVFPPAHTDILILGLDSRAGEGFLARTDSIMILGVSPAQLRVSTLSIPRDLFVETPGYGFQRINTINLLGEQEAKGRGPVLLADAIKGTLDIQIDRYIRVDFQGFVELIDAIGGVTLDVERTIVDDAFPMPDGSVMSVRFDAGVQHMDGERALIYARTRHADDDYRRASRQQQVLSALLSRLANPVRWPAALGVLNTAFDANLSLWDAIRLFPSVVLNLGRFDGLVIDRDHIITSVEGYAVPNLGALQPWLDSRFD